MSTETAHIATDEPSIRYVEQEFWTSRQRQASSLHEISYRACFKPQLPRYFIERYTEPGDLVYDPFMGRGTTVIEAALLGRQVAGNDINPLSSIITLPRLCIATPHEVEKRLKEIPFTPNGEAEIDLSMFYHPETLAEIVSLRHYLAQRKISGEEDRIDRWIRMVATNRLTGHSKGFFSVYTLPPNQATSPSRQQKINALRKQQPEYRNVKALILKKTRSLLRTVTPEQLATVNRIGTTAVLSSQPADRTPHLSSDSVQLTVTSPPFLDVVQYAQDNWLRCWFNMIDTETVAKQLTIVRTVQEWESVMQNVFHELYRITKPGGHVAFEVGEVRKGTIELERHVVPIGLTAGFSCEAILINRQSFTKTANIWGIHNNRAGTNTNRIVLFKKNYSGVNRLDTATR